MYGFRYAQGLKSSGTVSYDADAQAYFDSIGDVPLYAKNAFNSLVLSIKADGLWTDTKLFMPFLPTLTNQGGIRDARTNTVTATSNTSSTTSTTPLWSVTRAQTGINGVTYFGGGHIRTGVIPSTALTLDNSSWLAIYPDTDAVSASYNHGAYNSATQNITFQKRFTGNNIVAQMYNDTVGQGKVTASFTGSGGVFIANRTSNTSFKLYRNGSELASSSSTGGTLPSNQIVLNGYNTTGNGTNHTLGGIIFYGTSLTAGQVTSQNAAWTTFATAMKRTGTYAATILVDGDSHTTYFNGIFPRKIQWDFMDVQIKHGAFGVAGRTLSSQVSSVTANVYPNIVAGNGTHYVICGGGTNDIAAGTAAATVWTSMQSYINGVKSNAAGKGVTLKCIHFPLFNRKFTGNDSYILVHDQFNELVRNNYAVGDIYVDFPAAYSAKRSDYASDAEYITAVRAFVDNTAIYYDETHLNNSSTGYQYPASLIADAIATDSGL